MILCLVAMIVFGILGIFSAKYRALAKESFGCFFNTIQLKPCDSKFEQKIKSTIIAKIMRLSPGLAKTTYKNFAILSWIFTILFFASMAYSAYSVYNLVVYGTCSPGSYCIFNPNANVTGTNVCSIAGSPSEGSDSAKVVMVEFSDFQCPYCGDFARNVLPQIRENYVDTGKVKFVFKSFPLPQHQYAFNASEAAECARDQGKFWEMYDKLYQNQDALAVSDIKEYAIELELNISQFDQCLDSGAKASIVQNDTNYAIQMGIDETPTFYINDKKITGDQPYSVFQQAIDSELSAS